MWWQNASARTVPVSRSPSRTQARSSRVRTVVAPSRCLQKAAKSWSPSRAAEAALIAVDVERAWPGEDVAAGERVGDARRSTR